MMRPALDFAVRSFGCYKACLSMSFLNDLEMFVRLDGPFYYKLLLYKEYAVKLNKNFRV